MGSLIISTVVGAVAFMVGAYFLKGVRVDSFGQAIIVTIAISVLTCTLGEFIEFITPDKTLNWLTFGFFQFIMDALIIWVASKLLKKFEVSSFITAIILAIIVSVVTSIFYSIL